MFFFDPTYLLFMLPGVGLSLWASFRTKSAFRTYAKVPCARQLTGAQAARLMLDRAGLHHVGIGRSHGLLSDHYNPATRRLALSKDVHYSTSIAAIGVATHEAGHAIQHAAHYAPLWLRSTLVPTANVGSSIGYVVMMIGLFMASQSLVGIGALLFATPCHRRKPPGSVEGGAGRTSVSQSLSRTGHFVRRTFAEGCRTWAQSAFFLGNWRARQDSNLRPSA